MWLGQRCVRVSPSLGRGSFRWGPPFSHVSPKRRSPKPSFALGCTWSLSWCRSLTKFNMVRGTRESRISCSRDVCGSWGCTRLSGAVGVLVESAVVEFSPAVPRGGADRSTCQHRERELDIGRSDSKDHGVQCCTHNCCYLGTYLGRVYLARVPKVLVGLRRETRERRAEGVATVSDFRLSLEPRP